MAILTNLFTKGTHPRKFDLKSFPIYGIYFIYVYVEVYVYVYGLFNNNVSYKVSEALHCVL